MHWAYYLAVGTDSAFCHVVEDLLVTNYLHTLTNQDCLSSLDFLYIVSSFKSVFSSQKRKSDICRINICCLINVVLTFIGLAQH